MSSAFLKVLARDQAQSIGKGILARVAERMPGAKAIVALRSSASASTRFARNELLGVDGSTSLLMELRLEIDGRGATVITDRHDPAGIAALVAETEGIARSSRGERTLHMRASRPFSDPPLLFPSSLRAGEAVLQSDLVREVMGAAKRADMVGTGSLDITSRTLTVLNSVGFSGHTQKTYAEISVNARTPGGKGSGWAWSGTEDFARIDPDAVARRAVGLAKRSDNPVAIEPGRYTVILEPEAHAQFIDPVIGRATEGMSYGAAAAGGTVFSLFEGKKLKGTKIGLQMADRRVQLFSDPTDDVVPHSPLSYDGTIMTHTDWIKDGVLRNLATDDVHHPGVASLKIQGSRQTLDEMIASTKRGIWVHRFSEPAVMSAHTLLLTGVTRDGTFLIENGKVTKAIKNLRFSESPFFILNKIEAFGEPVRASQGIGCPRLKVRDFEFTSLSDAI